jgi:hypothetical protein
MRETTFIYGLWDPRNYQLRYIGKTKNLDKRLKTHIEEAKLSNSRNHRLNWIRQLLNEELEPFIEVLEECTNDTWEKAERDWIVECRRFGLKLTNGTDGGEGGIGEIVKGKPSHRKGKKLSPEHSEKIKKSMQSHVGVPRPEEVRKKIGKAQEGKIISEETRLKIKLASKGRGLGIKKSEEHKRKIGDAQLGPKNHRYGKKLTEEQKDRLRTISTGRKHSSDSIRKMSEAKKGKPRSEETKRKISESRKRLFAEKKKEAE